MYCVKRLAVLFSGICYFSMFATAQNTSGGKRGVLAAYFEEWSIYGANYNLADTESSGAAARLTHLFYAFGNVTYTPASQNAPASAACALADSWADFQKSDLPPVGGIADVGPLYGNFAELQKLKQLHPNLKVLISLGGASTANTAAFAAASATAELRSQLVSSCIDLFLKGNFAPGVTAPGIFDGVDIDWEFPTAADKQDLTALMQEFRTQLDQLDGKHHLLTFFGPAGSQNYSNIELAKVAALVDYMDVDGYDYHGTWETTTNNAAPVFGSPRDPSHDSRFWINATVDAYIEAGVPASKMVLGVPFYGYGWAGVPSTDGGLYQPSTGPASSPAGDSLQTPGVATYRTLNALTGFDAHWDPLTFAHWIYSPSTQTFWTFDTQAEVALKMLYVQRHQKGPLAGAFAWALKDDDANATLIKTMAAESRLEK